MHRLKCSKLFNDQCGHRYVDTNFRIYKCMEICNWDYNEQFYIPWIWQKFLISYMNIMIFYSFLLVFKSSFTSFILKGSIQHHMRIRYIGLKYLKLLKIYLFTLRHNFLKASKSKKKEWLSNFLSPFIIL